MKKTEDKILRVALLTRVSTEEQVVRGYSLQAQEDALVDFANKNNMKIVGIYRDEGHSARKPVLKRPVMLELLEDVKAEKFDRILFIKLDRWFRNVSEYHATQAILDKHNVTWQAILEDYQTVTADGRLKVNIMLSVAENEADRTSERIKFVFNARTAKKEALFNLPFGYKAEMIDGVRRAVKDPEVEDILYDFYKKALATNTRQAATAINQKYGLEYSYKFWRNCAIKEIYTGEYKGVMDFAPAYISKEQQEELTNKNRVVRKAQNNRVYIFSGLLRCPKCGKRLGTKYCTAGRKYSKEYIYYRCMGYMVGTCEFSNVTEKNIEKYLLENLRSEMEKHMLSAEAERHAEKKSKTKKNDIEKLQEKLRRLNVVFFAGNMTDEEYATQSNAIKNQIIIAQQEESKIERPVNVEAIKAFLKTDFENMYETLTKEERRTMWRSVIDEILLDGTKPVGIKFKA